MSSSPDALVLPLALALASLAPLAPPAPAPRAGTAADDDGLTLDEALELAFPECTVTRQVEYLSKEDQAALTKELGEEFRTGVVYAYVAVDREGKPVGTAWFDRHRVRSQRETLMVVVAPDGKVRRVEVLAFAEPRQYRPKAAWYEQFAGHHLGEDPAFERSVRDVAGATLTATATKACVRRILTVHRFLRQREERAAQDRAGKAGP